MTDVKNATFSPTYQCINAANRMKTETNLRPSDLPQMIEVA